MPESTCQPCITGTPIQAETVCCVRHLVSRTVRSIYRVASKKKWLLKWRWPLLNLYEIRGNWTDRSVRFKLLYRPLPVKQFLFMVIFGQYIKNLCFQILKEDSMPCCQADSWRFGAFYTGIFILNFSFFHCAWANARWVYSQIG